MVKIIHPAVLAGGAMAAASFPPSPSVRFPVRPARSRDHAALAVMASASFRQGAAALLPAELRSRADAARFLELLGAGGALLMAGSRAQPLGCILAEPLLPGSGSIRLTGLWVAQNAAGQGVGSALLGAMEARLLEEGASVVSVRVPSGHLRTLGLFRRRGYILRTAGRPIEPILGVALPQSELAKSLLATGCELNAA